MIYILTGGINSGKTSALSSWVALWRRQGRVVRGILAPARWIKGQKVSYDIQDVLTGKHFLYASREPLENAESYGDFWFSREGLDFGENLLSSLGPETEICVVDEIGPLELAGRGWAASFRSLLSHPPQNLVVVVRESLVRDVTEAFSFPRVTILHRTSECPVKACDPEPGNQQ